MVTPLTGPTWRRRDSWQILWIGDFRHIRLNDPRPVHRVVWPGRTGVLGEGEGHHACFVAIDSRRGTQRQRSSSFLLVR